MRALSGLTPALSKRLQRQLLAHLPAAAARDLRRTLSLHAPTAEPPPRAARSHSASKSLDGDRARSPDPPPPQPAPDDAPASAARSPSVADETPDAPMECTSPQYSTLPRLRRRSSPRETTPPTVASDAESVSSSRRASADRPLLSKYLTPERHLSLDDAYPPESSSILSEPSYIAAYGGGAPGIGLRRHSLRLTGDAPRKRVSRFLRSDFFDSPTDESLYAKHKKEKELETQKILREIREKRNRAEVTTRSPAEADDGAVRKCVSPISSITGKERSRSNTPFFPILDNIKETVIDAAVISDSKSDSKQKTRFDDDISKESRLIRPKSFPIKTLDSIDEPSENAESETAFAKETDSRDKRESKLIRPKSYPTSSPSPEKVYINRNINKDENKSPTPKNKDGGKSEIKSDVEVSFSITLPRKKSETLPKVDVIKINEPENAVSTKQEIDKKSATSSLTVKKYQISNSTDLDKTDIKDHKFKNGNAIPNGTTDATEKTINGEINKSKILNSASKKEVKKTDESESNEKKGTIKKKIIRKVSSKSKTDIGSGQDASDAKTTTEKKKVTKKIKEKTDDDTAKSNTVTKKKSMLQSIGHKLEKFASSKSNSPEKAPDNSVTSESKKDLAKLKRTQREQSVPVNVEPLTESNLIKRAVTLTDVAALETQPPNNNKTTVSKVLGLFKKFEPKEKTKPIMEKSQSIDTAEISNKSDVENDSVIECSDKEKPRRPTSLLLNGLGRKNKYSRTTSDSISNLTTENDDNLVLKKETDITSRNKNSLKLDFSRLPRVKKIVPTNSVIEPQIMNTSSVAETEKKDVSEKTAITLESIIDNDTYSRSRSRSRSTVSNSELKADVSAETNKYLDKNPLSPSDNGVGHPLRNHEATSPEREDIVDRIRRKSFYSRFNEKKQRRKSSLVGPGAAEYDPLARIHAPPTETKFDVSPTSPGAYDLSPGLSASSDLSPSTERYRSLLSEPVSTRNNIRYENYALSDKVDTYRSLDRNDFRKYPGSRSYLDYDQPLSYGTQRYSRTKSLLDSADGTEENDTHSLRDPLKYNRTISMYSPGNYATYRPKRTHNPAIILKESEKEPSPENILEKIKQRKNFSISVTRKPDPVKDPLPRSPVPSKGESDSTECSEKVD